MSKIPLLFELMNARGITAKKLSKDTKISSGNISDWKSGRSCPTLDKLKILSKYFNVSVDYLLGNNQFYLTENEQLLINKYRTMTAEQQEKMLQNINVL